VVASSLLISFAGFVMADQSPQHERELLHALKNQLSIVVGFSDLVFSETPPEDPRHADLAEIQRAARAAMAIIPELVKKMR
jgi:hypothetical protein